jgi:hypothetical protein
MINASGIDADNCTLRRDVTDNEAMMKISVVKDGEVEHFEKFRFFTT